MEKNTETVRYRHLEKIRCIVERITYKNEDAGYTVLLVDDKWKVDKRNTKLADRLD